MAKAEMTVHLRIRDTDRARLFALELQFLRDEMRVAADPYAERLERIIDRFFEGGDDERPEDAD
jgi:hypothetical protein